MLKAQHIIVAVFVFVVLTFSALNLQAATPGISLVGKGLVDGTLLDKSGLTGNICQAGAPANCISKAILGGFGSDITYTGYGLRVLVFAV